MSYFTEERQGVEGVTHKCGESKRERQEKKEKGTLGYEEGGGALERICDRPQFEGPLLGEYS